MDKIAVTQLVVVIFRKDVMSAGILPQNSLPYRQSQFVATLFNHLIAFHTDLIHQGFPVVSDDEDLDSDPKSLIRT